MTRYAVVADQLWDGLSDHVRKSMAVLINGRTIEALVTRVPGSVKVLRFRGCVIPGLIDAHAHYSASMGPAFLAAGVTTIRDTGNDLDWILAQREKNDRQPASGPGILACGFLLDGPRPYWSIMGRGHASSRALRASIRDHARRRIDAIKLYDGLPLSLLRIGIEEGHRHGLPVLADLGEAVTAEAAVRAGVDEIEHLKSCTPAWRESAVRGTNARSSSSAKDRLIDLFARRGVAVTPTLVLWDRMSRLVDLAFEYDARRRWIHPCYLELWRDYPFRTFPVEARLGIQASLPSLKRFVSRMYERGARVAVGTDTPFPHLVPGFSVHDELSLYVDAGVKTVDALRSATSTAAEIIRQGSRIGRIAPGMQADLVVVGANPLEDFRAVSRIECVIRAGTVLRPDDLAASLAGIHAKRNNDPVTRAIRERLRLMSGRPARSDG